MKILDKVAEMYYHNKAMFGIILAGGKGERFWPKSTVKRPKQILPITSAKPLLIETIDRLTQVIPRERIIIVTGKDIEPFLRKLVPDIKLLTEPFGRNTACAIAYAALNIPQDATMAVFPADHWIPENKPFIEALKQSVAFAKKGYLVTFGIVPTRAETGYGYIETDRNLDDVVYSVKSFKEKPNQKQAQDFLRKKKFLWNSGIFVWSNKNILSAFQTYMPDFYELLMKFRNKKISLLELYKKVSNISIDYAVMEKAEKVAVIKANFPWDDVGSWLALERVYTPDKLRNIKIGLTKGLSTNNCIIVSDKGLVATLGVSNLVVVKSGDAVLVCDKNSIDDIKQLVHSLADNSNLKKYL